jgi:membrane-anchored protein YejM (alkaline phosphatase superfamily)
LYDKSSQYYLYEYTKQFFNIYKDQPKVFRVGLFEGHEGTYEVIKYYDSEITNFFEEFKNLGYLDDTVVFIQSDHGLSVVGLYSTLGLEDYSKEVVLPSFFLLVPTNLKDYESLRKNLKHNENTLITPFNIHNSLLAILNDGLTYSSFDDNKDIFNSKVSKKKVCKSWYDEDYFYQKDFLCKCEK